MTEEELELEVLRRIRGRGYIVLDIPDSRRLVKLVDQVPVDVGLGWPDLTIIGRTGILFRELKAAGGQLTSDERRVSYALKGTGADWAVWRPVHLEAGNIDDQLERIG